MSNSPLVDVTVMSPNHSGKRTHSIDTITPHCVVGQLSAESIGKCFVNKSKEASCNYGIGKDGRIVMCVDEDNRSWCSSNRANDQRAVTIECASDKEAPFAFNSTVYSKLIELCVDICKRNGKKKLLWLKDKATSTKYEPKEDEMILTVHRWFTNKSCPGDWMMERMGDLADKVTAKLSGSEKVENKTPEKTDISKNEFEPYTVKVSISDLNIRKGPGTNYAKIGKFTGKGVFTIVEESTGEGSKKGWGKLKSGAGWISLDWATKLK